MEQPGLLASMFQSLSRGLPRLEGTNRLGLREEPPTALLSQGQASDGANRGLPCQGSESPSSCRLGQRYPPTMSREVRGGQAGRATLVERDEAMGQFPRMAIFLGSEKQ